jgi:hypothetical protein
MPKATSVLIEWTDHKSPKLLYQLLAKGLRVKQPRNLLPIMARHLDMEVYLYLYKTKK